MGFDIYMRVVAKCSLEKFLKIHQREFMKSMEENKLFNKYLPNIEDIFSEISRGEFFKKIIGLSYKSDQLRVASHTIFDLVKFEQLDDYLSNNYANFLFFKNLLLALDEDRERSEEEPDDDIELYCELFDDLHRYFKVKDEKVKICVCHASSYKGCENVDIDYKTIATTVEILKERFPNIEIITKLGMSN